MILVRTIQKRFVQPLLDGTKVTTIRPSPWPVGAIIDFRIWTGRPYWSKQEHVTFREVSAVYPVTIRIEGIEFEHFDGSLDNHAKEDGFSCWSDMRDWFFANHKKAMKDGGFSGHILSLAAVCGADVKAASRGNSRPHAPERSDGSVQADVGTKG